jgi:hypothetical protein
MTRITLNLLSPARKAALRTDFVFAYVQASLVAMCLLAFFAAGTLAGVRALVRNVLGDLTARSSSSSQEHEAFTAEVRSINGYLARIDGLDAGVPWSSVLRTVTEAAPAGIRLDAIRASHDGSIKVSGTAAVREDMLEYRTRIESSPLFEKITSPLSNILQQRDVKFEFEFRYAAIPLPPPPDPAKKPAGKAR